VTKKLELARLSVQEERRESLDQLPSSPNDLQHNSSPPSLSTTSPRNDEPPRVSALRSQFPTSTRISPNPRPPSMADLHIEPAEETIRLIHPQPHKPSQSILDLDHQIATLASGVDAFSTERNATSRMLAKERQSSKDRASPRLETRERIWHLEQECERLARMQESLRLEFLAFQNAALAREKSLLEEVEGLHHRMRLCLPPVRNEALQLMDEYDGEQSMDLATPLSPMALLSTYSPVPTVHSNGSPHLDPLLVPLPESPSEIPSESLFAEPALTDFAQGTYFQHAERRLTIAQEELEKGEAALADIKMAVENLQHRLAEGNSS
jgi:hypothetical protein